MKMKTEVRLFLSDPNEMSVKVNDDIFHKVRFDEELDLIYKERKGYKISNMQMQIVGVYSKTRNDFIIICDRYNAESLFFNVDDIGNYYETDLVTKITSAIHTEIDNICINLSHSSKSIEYWNDIRQKARQHYLNFSYPQFELNVDFSLTLENLSEYLRDEDEFIFEEAESFFNQNLSLKDRYMEFVDIKNELDKISKNPDTLLLIQKTLKSDVICNSYKKISLVLVDKNGNEEKIQGQNVKDVYLYPIYAIKEIYWGRKQIFDISNFNAGEVRAFRTSLEYNKEYIDTLYQKKSYDTDEKGIMQKYIPDLMYDIEKFRDILLRKGQSNLRIFPKTYLENKNFIRSINNLYLSNYVSYVDENYLLNNEDFIFELVENSSNIENEYRYLPEIFQTKTKFLKVLAEKNFERIIDYVNKTNIQDVELRDLIINYYNTNPKAPVARYWSSDSHLFIVDEEDAILNMTTTNNFKYLPEKYRSSKSFVMKFLNRMVDYMKHNSYDELKRELDFNQIYNYLGISLKKDTDILMLLIKNSRITTYIYDCLDKSVKTDDFCLLAIEGNIDVLQYATSTVKDRIIKEKPKLISHLRYCKFGGNGSSLLSKQLIQIATLSLTSDEHLRFFSNLTYAENQDAKTLLSCLKINKDIYQKLSTTATMNKTLAEYMSGFCSVLPYLGTKQKFHHNSIYDDKEIMTRCIHHNPRDFMRIPISSRQTGTAPLLEDFDFVKTAVELYSFNINHLDKNSKFRESKEIAKICLLDDITLVDEFSRKTLRDEDFVFEFVREYTKKKLDIKALKDVYLTNFVNKKTLNSKEFKSEFPELC